MAFHLLQGGRGGARTLAEALTDGLASISAASAAACSPTPSCARSARRRRATRRCCASSNPPRTWWPSSNPAAIRGRYFVLHGHLSPLDGIGPEQIGAREFEALLDSGEVREVILATNPTVEGEATAHFLGERAAREASGRAESRTACRSVVSSNTSTAARSPTR